MNDSRISGRLRASFGNCLMEARSCVRIKRKCILALAGFQCPPRALYRSSRSCHSTHGSSLTLRGRPHTNFQLPGNCLRSTRCVPQRLAQPQTTGERTSSSDQKLAKSRVHGRPPVGEISMPQRLSLRHQRHCARVHFSRRSSSACSSKDRVHRCLIIEYGRMHVRHTPKMIEYQRHRHALYLESPQHLCAGHLHHHRREFVTFSVHPR